MSLTRIDLAQATDLTDATRWVFDPDKELSAGAALRHIHLEQISNEKAAITAYATGRVWLQKLAPAQGVIGTQHLYDGEDLISRVAKPEIWRKSALRVTQNRNNSIKLECVERVEADGTVIASGNINIGTYGGDLADFEIPSAEEYELVGSTAQGYDFKTACRIAADFSGLRGDASARAVWICVESGELRLSVTERASDRGIGLLTYAIPAAVESPLRFGFQGRHLTRVADIISENPTLSIHVDSLEEPTRVRFSGFGGWVDLPVVEDYYCRALSQGAMGIFKGENYPRTESTALVFDSSQLADGVSIQTPKKGATRNDLVLELENQKLVISKRSDIRRSEQSGVPLSVATDQTWLPVVVDHTYFTDAIQALDSYLKAAAKRATSFEFDEENPTEPSAYLSITQSVTPHPLHLLLLRPHPLGDYECQVALIVNTKANTNDYNEAD